MDLYDIVRLEDRKVLSSVRRLQEAAGTPALAATRLAEVHVQLEARRRAMEGMIYPLLRASVVTRAGVERSGSELEAIGDLLERLRGTDPADPAFRSFADCLHRQTRAFLEREHREIFARVWQALPEEQAERLAIRLARELGDRRRRAEEG